MFIEQGAMQLNHIKHICIIFKYIHLMYGPKHKNAHQYYYFLCFITWNHVMTMLCIFFLYFLIFPCDAIAYFDIFQTYSTPKLSPSHFLTICEKTKRLIHLFRFVQNYKLLLFTFLVPRLRMTLK